MLTTPIYLRNEFHLSEVNKSVNYIVSRATGIHSEGVVSRGKEVNP